MKTIEGIKISKNLMKITYLFAGIIVFLSIWCAIMGVRLPAEIMKGIKNFSLLTGKQY